MEITDQIIIDTLTVFRHDKIQLNSNSNFKLYKKICYLFIKTLLAFINIKNMEVTDQIIIDKLTVFRHDSI